MFWYTPYKRKAIDVDQIDFHMCQLHSRCDQVSYVRLHCLTPVLSSKQNLFLESNMWKVGQSNESPDTSLFTVLIRRILTQNTMWLKHLGRNIQQVYLYKSLESSRSSDILFYNEHSSIYMLMHPTVRPIYWVIYMYIFWTIMRERERDGGPCADLKRDPPPPKNSNFVIFNVLRVNLREKSYPRFFYDTYVITLIANQTSCTHACA